MTWREAVEVVAAGHEPYRRLCSDDNPDPATREGYRRLVVRLATGQSTGVSAPDPATPEDLALRAYVARRGGCCG